MFKVCIMITEITIWFFQNSNKCVTNPGVKDSIIFVLIRLKTKMKANIVFPMESKNAYIECIPESEPFQ